MGRKESLNNNKDKNITKNTTKDNNHKFNNTDSNNDNSENNGNDTFNNSDKQQQQQQQQHHQEVSEFDEGTSWRCALNAWYTVILFYCVHYGPEQKKNTAKIAISFYTFPQVQGWVSEKAYKWAARENELIE